MTDRRDLPRPRLVVPILAALLALVYLPLFFGQVLYQRDVGRLLYPVRWFVQTALAHGEAPFWNPLEGLGTSAFADPQYGLFYPPNLLLLVGDPARGVTWLLFLHMLWGGAGAALLAARLRVGVAAALIAGLGWSLAGMTTSEWTAGYRLIAGSWMPWCGLGFVALAQAAAEPSRRWLRAAAVAATPVAAALLSGEPFVAMMDAGFGLALALVVFARGGALASTEPVVAPRGVPRRRLAAGFALALALAASIGAVAVLPSAKVAGQTARAGRLPRGEAERLSFHPLRTIELLAPGAMGEPYLADYPAGPIVGDATLGDRPITYGVYLGGSVIALALVGLGRGRRTAAAVGGLALFALALAYGRHLPLHAIFRLVVLPFAYMRAPEKYLAWMVVLCALLAAGGAERWLSTERALRPWRRLAGLCALLLLIAPLAPLTFPDGVGRFVRAGALHGAAGVAAVLALGFLPLRRPIAAALLVGCVAADLALAAWPLQSFAPPSMLTTRPPAAATIIDQARERSLPLPPRVHRAPDVDLGLGQFSPPRTLIDVQRNLLATLVDNTSATFGIAGVPGYSAATPNALRRFFPGGAALGFDALRLLAVDYVVLPVDPASLIDPLASNGVERVSEPLPGSRLYRVDWTLPRIYLAHTAVEATDEQAREAVFLRPVLRGWRALVAPGSGLPLPSGPVGRAGECTLGSFAFTKIEATCTADAPALAVFVEQWDPGWTASVDGAPAKVLRTNLLARGVVVPAGAHSIALEFHPQGLAAGCAISIAGLLVLVAVFMLGRHRGV